MVSREEYQEIKRQIEAILQEAASPLDPAGLVACLRKQGIRRELGSTIMWEMIGAGQITRSEDWRLRLRGTKQEAEVFT